MPRNLACLTNAAISIVRLTGTFCHLPKANRYYAARPQDALDEILTTNPEPPPERVPCDVPLLSDSADVAQAGLIPPTLLIRGLYVLPLSGYDEASIICHPCIPKGEDLHEPHQHPVRRNGIEVKASQNDPQSFELGETEVRAARMAARPRSGLQYNIAYVSNVSDLSKTNIEMLPNPMTDEGAHVLQLRGEGIRYSFSRNQS